MFDAASPACARPEALSLSLGNSRVRSGTNGQRLPEANYSNYHVNGILGIMLCFHSLYILSLSLAFPRVSADYLIYMRRTRASPPAAAGSASVAVSFGEMRFNFESILSLFSYMIYIGENGWI